MEERKQRWLKGSFTVEMAFLMPMILFLIMGCIRISFYYHDKNVIAGAAYETAVTGSTKVREKDGISESELNALFKERVGRKCILFSRIRVQSSVGKDEIKVQAAARRKKMAISVESRAAVTEPEKYIRDIRRIKNEKDQIMERKITIEEHVLYKEDYQMKMLKANSPEGFLHVGGRGVNGSSYYDYDVSGKVSMQAMYARAKLKAEDIRHFMEQLGNVLKEAERYLLDIHCILMDPEYIFYEEGRYYFCYYPLAKQDIWEKFHILTEYMVKVADYQEEECVRLAFLLHKETMEDNYSLEKLIAACEETKKGETKIPDIRKETMIDELLEERREKTSYYDTREHDWISEQEMGSSIMRETDNLWMPVKRFLNKHKKSKWGDWDGLHIEEEEL